MVETARQKVFVVTHLVAVAVISILVLNGLISSPEEKQVVVGEILDCIGFIAVLALLNTEIGSSYKMKYLKVPMRSR